ncbi:hypothetical protein [Psychromonas ossibalaenae]|uniref:hypothetical protein n=1 Tax=Psychromonas ossibalaenae TaxID=444922 RepID=UPI00037D7489|nr:hypothetical protein [Psychromonas ossibalaenae]
MNTFIKQLMILSTPLLLAACGGSGVDDVPAMKVNPYDLNNKGSEQVNINKDIKQHARFKVPTRLRLKHLQRANKRLSRLL